MTRTPMAGPLSGIHVVLVEDHQDSRELFEQVLRMNGASVTAAASAPAVLGALASAHIVITDIFLPGEDGVWLLAQVQQLPRAIPVIALTGISPAHDPQLAAAGFARTFLKPIDPWDLCQVIAEILERGA